MLAVQDKYSNVVEQNVRLEARIQAIEMNAQSDNDSFKSEVFCFITPPCLLLPCFCERLSTEMSLTFPALVSVDF